jgi:hypothetical protein
MSMIGGMLKSIPFLVLLAVTSFAQDSAKYEAQIWSLEKAYWECVGSGFESRPTQSL